jgi:glycerol-3-phosphate acyltransferase PlsY
MTDFAISTPGVTFLLCFLFGYLLGSVPFGLLLTRAAGAGDIRQVGSGNIGATNVLRTGKKGLALATLLLDGGKGAAAVLVLFWLPLPFGLIAGAGAFLGHIYPVWLGFKGGKGVATFFGFLLGAAWPVGLASIAVWLLTGAVGRISSLAALVAAAATPFIAQYWGPEELVLPSGVLAAIIFVRHTENIQRLYQGKEPRIGGKKAE